mgnify:CR=1 FL=1
MPKLQSKDKRIILFADRHSNRGTLSYEEFLRRCISDNVDPDEGAAVELGFRYTTGGIQSKYRIHRLWNRNGKGIREYLDITRDGKLDRHLTNEWAIKG